MNILLYRVRFSKVFLPVHTQQLVCLFACWANSHISLRNFVSSCMQFCHRRWLSNPLLPVSCKSFKSFWCLTSPEDHNHQKIYMRWRSGKVAKCPSNPPAVQESQFFLEDHQDPVKRREDEWGICWPKAYSCLYPATWKNAATLLAHIYVAHQFSLFRTHCACRRMITDR